MHNLAQHRFEAVLPEGLSRADYRRVGDTMHLVHSEVPWALEGRGIAGELVQAALDYAAANGLKVIPHARTSAPTCGAIRTLTICWRQARGSDASPDDTSGAVDDAAFQFVPR